MSDKRLREALEWMDSGERATEQEAHDRIGLVREAARLVLDAKEVWWCKQHGSSATVKDTRVECDWLRWALGAGKTPPLCVMVPARVLVEPEGFYV